MTDPTDEDPARPEPERPRIIDPYPNGMPRKRRGFLFYFPPRQVIAISSLIIALIAILGLRQSCSQGVGNLFKAMEAADAGPPPAPPR
jgi:hypothetical protein